MGLLLQVELHGPRTRMGLTWLLPNPLPTPEKTVEDTHYLTLVGRSLPAFLIFNNLPGDGETAPWVRMKTSRSRA